MSDKLNQYVEKGLYGAKETKVAERRQYLGTIRERIVLVLTKSQVRKKEGLDRLGEEMKQNKNARLLLNGEMSFRFLTDYKKLADRHGILYTTVSNRKANTDIGLVLTHDHAIDKEDIFFSSQEKKSDSPNKEKLAFLTKLRSLFKSKS